MKIKESRRPHRNLSSRDRTGGHTRRIVINTVGDFIRPNWLPLLALLLLPGTIAFLTSLFLNTSARNKALYIGALGASGPWIVAILVIVWTGVGNQLMGLEAEHRTADVLRKYDKKDWRLVNGLRLHGDWDIDHVLVGPPGVLILESKWSHYEWPARLDADYFMARRLQECHDQVRRNTESFQKFFKSNLVGMTATPVCVLWSKAYKETTDMSVIIDGVVFVHGPKLEKWLATLTAHWVDVSKKEELIGVLAAQAKVADERVSKKENGPLPTVGTYLARNVGSALLGFTVFVSGLLLTLKTNLVWFIILSPIPLLIFAGRLTRTPDLRRFAQGGLAACGFFICILVFGFIQFFTR